MRLPRSFRMADTPKNDPPPEPEGDFEQWLRNVPPKYKKKLITLFVQNTVDYATDHLRMRLSELEQNEAISKEASEDEKREAVADTEHRLDRLKKWVSYIDFQQHTLQELAGSKIDRLIP